MTRPTVDSVHTVEAIYEALARGDLAAVVGAMDEDVEWYEAEGNPGHPGHPFVGPQQALDGVLARIGQQFEDFRVEPHRFLGAGDTVVVEARYHAGSHRATGKPWTCRWRTCGTSGTAEWSAGSSTSTPGGWPTSWASAPTDRAAASARRVRCPERPAPCGRGRRPWSGASVREASRTSRTHEEGVVP